LGEATSELTKLAALLGFGVMFSPWLTSHLTFGDVVFVVVALLVVRPVALLVAFVGRSLDLPLFAAAAWFGPKGFATVTFSLIVLQRGIVDGDVLFHAAGIVVVTSIVAHSSTDVPAARYFARAAERESRRARAP
jgi:NhaP-type Na+/H+ and K+/H+ antiporter